MTPQELDKLAAEIIKFNEEKFGINFIIDSTSLGVAVHGGVEFEIKITASFTTIS